MANRIKGITVEIGGDTTKLDRALSGTNKEISATQRALKDVERLLKLDPGNVTLLEQKQRLLGQQTEATAKKLDTLRKAAETADEALTRNTAYEAKYQPLKAEIEQVEASLIGLQANQEQMERKMESGELSAEKYDAFCRKIEETSARLDALRSEQSAVEQEFSGAKMDRGQYDALQREILETENRLRDLEEQSRDSNVALEHLSSKAGELSEKAGKVQSAMSPITKAVGAIGAAAVATVPATEELRSDLSKLDASARAAGVGMDTARDVMSRFVVVSDEVDSSVEATSNLLQAGFTESNLQIAMENLSGAYLRFPDTLKIESLADSLQETLATGQATGQFAELMDRLGIGVDQFNQGLASAASTGDQYNYVLNQLAHSGLADTYTAWLENNQALIDNKEATFEFQKQTAAFAETIQPLITSVTNLATAFLEWFNGLSTEGQNAIMIIMGVIGAIGPIAGIVSNLSGIVEKCASWIPKLADKFSDLAVHAAGAAGVVRSGLSSALAFLAANPAVAVVAAIAAIVAIIAVLWNTNEAFRNGVIEIWNGIQEKFESFDSWISDAFAADWTEKFGALGNILNGFGATSESIWEHVKQTFSGIISFLTGVFSGDWEQALQGLVDVFSGVFGLLADAAKAPFNAVIGVINAALGAITDAVNAVIDKVNSISVDVPSWVPGVGGKSLGFSLSGLSAPQIPYLAQGTVAQPNHPFLAVLGDNTQEPEIVAPYSVIRQAVADGTQATQGGAGGSMTAYMYLDGQKFARLITPYLNAHTARMGVDLVKG